MFVLMYDVLGIYFTRNPNFYIKTLHLILNNLIKMVFLYDFLQKSYYALLNYLHNNCSKAY